MTIRSYIYVFYLRQFLLKIGLVLAYTRMALENDIYDLNTHLVYCMSVQKRRKKNNITMVMGDFD